jgi:uncharacterized protein involved in outer membrane biogenesis
LVRVDALAEERDGGEPLDFGWLKGFDGHLAVDASGLTWGRTHYDHPNVSLSLADGTLQLDSLSAQLWGGRLTANGRLDAAGHVATQAALDSADAHEAMLGLADLDLAQGQLNGALRLSSSGRGSGEMLAHLAGNGSFAVKDGLLRGFDLKAVDQKLQAIDSPAGLLALMQAGINGGATHFSKLGGTFRIERGVVTTDDLTMTAEGGGATASGAANLPGNAIDARAQFHLDSASAAPPLVMRLTGPLDHPRRFIDINEIQTWLAQRGGGDKLKGLQQLLGKPPQEGAADGSVEKPAKLKPKDLLKGLLQGLR